ncbi:urease accessory protein UreF [Saccharopolyspora rhizosphaerae]|uniref:Urease accessory protein UreF n=1 Tax=Saccharopolyspora rhizosphaerae TaxID=2492662 RepID=A0A3R8P343_9PSEU|nr:urease accessory UreF family protein [Saccharopolyspora rhizosphaerae]RRO15373.1 urease accessory protein UreF [Saccharopolyspora rhizosphaerae]
MGLAALALADSRFPGGGHVHSGGVEEASSRGLLRSTADLREFLRGRLFAAGSLQAVFAAAAAHAAQRGVHSGHWADLDAELDARTPSPAQREASRAQGRGMLRAGRAAWPSPVLDRVVAETPRPHQPVVLGVLAASAGSPPREAALIAGYLAISGPASAGVRLLGLDPFEANAALVALSAELDQIADEAARVAGLTSAELPAPGAPALDLLAEAHDRHHREEVRLFAS